MVLNPTTGIVGSMLANLCDGCHWHFADLNVQALKMSAFGCKAVAPKSRPDGA
jgi:hypothetical protein